MKTVSLLWTSPIGAGRYKFAYKKGEQVDVPLNDKHRIAIAAGLATCQDSNVQGECQAFYDAARQKAFNAYVKSLEKVKADPLNTIIPSWVTDELTKIWGFDWQALRRVEARIMNPKRDL